MPTENEIKQLAHAIWEQEGKPEGKELEHYFRAQKTLEERKKELVIELASPQKKLQLEPQPPITELSPPPTKRKKFSRRRK